ncbi:MAG: hypothetical protein R6U63_05015 [Longimicrobiales bacterium]
MTIAVVAMLTACSMRGVPATLDPATADTAVRSTMPDRPLRAVFAWEVLDSRARFAGDGAARIEPPYHVRLDLFGPRGEGFLSAALVGTEIRLPGEPNAALPPPALIWSALGVVRPPEDAVLQGTREWGGTTELHYATDDGRLRYTLEDGRLRSVEWRRSSGRMVVELQGHTPGLPASASYRNWANNTELHIELESVEEVEPYPPEIWTPGR